MDHSPKTSLIVTIYNREHYLAQAIESALTQTAQDFELLLWDDGSTDHSLAIAYKYAKQDDRIRVFESSHLGRASALKSAHEHAKGKYVGWLDSDDLLAATCLQETVQALDTYPDIGVVYTDYIVIDGSGEFIEYGKKTQVPYSKDQMLVQFMASHFRLMRRSLYEQVGGVDSSYDVCMDVELCFRLSELAEFLHLQGRALYFYRWHKDSISGQRRVDQIRFTEKAILEAMQRRGMNNDYELETQIFARFSLFKERA